MKNRRKSKVASEIQNKKGSNKKKIQVDYGSDIPSTQQSASSESSCVFDVASVVKSLNLAIKDIGIPQIDNGRLRYKKYATEKFNEIMQFLSKNVFDVE